MSAPEMIGITLVGGKGTRLEPLTDFRSKQLLPVYRYPMVYYTIFTLIKAGIRRILVISDPDNLPQYVRQLSQEQQEGRLFTDVDFDFKVQKRPEGLAQAFIIGEHNIGNNKVIMILGDNIFVGHDFSKEIQAFEDGALIFATQVPDPQRFGVVWFDGQMRATKIIEKPPSPDSNWAVVGLYTFSPDVVEVAKSVKPSARGELEIVDVIAHYFQEGRLVVHPFEGKWFDAGTPDSLLAAGNAVRDRMIENGGLL